MKNAFLYAKNEALGMQFETFTYSTNGLSYRWDVGPLVVWLCQWLITYSESVTEVLFNRLVKVTLQ